MLINGNIIDVIERSIYPARMEIQDGKIRSICKTDEHYDRYILPGFIDAHVHIESSMLSPAEFAVQAVKHGTVAVVTDPHEIANVLGVEGIDFMILSGEKVPLKFYFGLPSCVPATSYESNGFTINAEQTGELIKRKDLHFLAEMMNYPGVVSGDKEVLSKINYALKVGKPVDGHAPGLRGEDLKKYISAGISTDHEAYTIEEARDKIANGMIIQIREGSAARNLVELAPLFNEHPNKLMLCSDDIHPEMLLKRHINGPVKYLIEQGYDLFDILRAVSYNTVLHYNLDVGLLREGDRADFIIVNDLRSLEIDQTWIDGECAYSEGETRFKTEKESRPNVFNCSCLSENDIVLKNKGGKMKVIEVKDGDLLTGCSIEKWCDDDIVQTSLEQDILKIVVKDRYKDKAPSVAFIRGFKLKRGAFASSVAHDSHNLIAVGVDDKSIVAAINSLVEKGGGLSVADGDKLETLELPIAGIMTDVPCGTIAAEYLKISDMVSLMGSDLKAPFMTLSFMALLVIPELKLGDAGLFDGQKFEFTEIFVDQE